MHVNVRYDAAGHTAPPTPTASTRRGRGLESFARLPPAGATDDILWAKSTLSEQLPGFMPVERSPCRSASYGQDAPTTRASRATCGASCAGNFQAVFLTEPPEYTTRRRSRDGLGRIEIHSDTGTNQLYRWLAERRRAAGREGRLTCAASSDTWATGRARSCCSRPRAARVPRL